VAFAKAQEPAVDYVKRRRIGPISRARYDELALGFQGAARAMRVPLVSHADVDAFFDSQLTALFFAGAALQEARNLFYAVNDAYRVSAGSFPLAQATLKGFGKDSPDEARDGCTLEEAILIADWLVKQGGPDTCTQRAPS